MELTAPPSSLSSTPLVQFPDRVLVRDIAEIFDSVATFASESKGELRHGIGVGVGSRAQFEADHEIHSFTAALGAVIKRAGVRSAKIGSFTTGTGSAEYGQAPFQYYKDRPRAAIPIQGGPLTLDLEDAISHSLKSTVENDTELDSLNQNKAAACYAADATGTLYLALSSLSFEKYKIVRVSEPLNLLTPR